MGFGPGSEIRMKFEVVESRKENYMYLTTMGGNVSINCTAAQSFGHRADIVGATSIQVYTAAYGIGLYYMGVFANPSETHCQIRPSA